MIYALVPDELPPRALPSVTPSSSAHDARAAVLEAFGEPGDPDSVSLSFNGTALEDDKPLSEYGVEIHALVRAELSR
jgi:HEAT repeat protein